MLFALVLLVLLCASTTTSAASLPLPATNAERFRRGLPPNPPPTRCTLAERPGTSAAPSARPSHFSLPERRNRPFSDAVAPEDQRSSQYTGYVAICTSERAPPLGYLLCSSECVVTSPPSLRLPTLVRFEVPRDVEATFDVMSYGGGYEAVAGYAFDNDTASIDLTLVHQTSVLSSTVQSTIWTISVSGLLTPHWVVPDGTRQEMFVAAVFSSDGDIGTRLYLSSDMEELRTTHGAEHVVGPLTMKLVGVV